jgi:hypothetical protein
MKAEELLKVFLTAVCFSIMCGCVGIELSEYQQADLNESLSKAGLHAKFRATGISGITLDDPVQSELSGPSLEQLVETVREFRDRNHLTSMTSVGIQGPTSYMSIDHLGPVRK